MCGIWGLVKRDILAYQKAGESIQPILNHRGPDGEGLWISESANSFLGHVRLSIQDVSEHGAQPMQSACGNYIISYNGEIYNKRELKALVPSYPFKGHSDTEIILANIATNGLERTLGHLIGMFAIAILDLRDRKLHIVRDRIGIKPLYYSIWNDSLFFASELAPFKQIGLYDLAIDFDAVSLYTRHNYIPDPYTIYQNIKKLEPGHCLSFDVDTFKQLNNSAYWSIERFINPSPDEIFQTFDEAVNFYEQLLMDSISRRLVADVPLGCFLSGGYDSTAVAALMQKVSSSPVKTFSIGFSEDAYNEATYAKEVSAILGTDHHELYVTEQEALDVVPNLSTIYDEPFADSSQIPTYLVSKMARKHVTVCLSGDGGDELFGGYNRYIWLNQLNSKINTFPRGIQKLFKSLILSLSKDKWDVIFRLLGFMLPKKYCVNLPGDKLYKLANFVDQNSLLERYRSIVSLVQQPSQICLNSTYSDVIMPYSESVCDLSDISIMQYLDIKTYLPGDILTKVDRASMAVSLEARVPLLDHRLIESMWRIPDEYKVRNDGGKRLLKSIVHKYVPAKLMDRPKMGFGVPVGKWLNTSLKDFAEEYLSEHSLTQHSIYNVSFIRQMWADHKNGIKNNDYILWGVLMMQLWLSQQKQNLK